MPELSYYSEIRIYLGLTMFTISFVTALPNVRYIAKISSRESYSRSL